MTDASKVSGKPLDLARKLAGVAGMLLQLLGLVVLVITFTPLVNWWAGRLAGPWNDARGDVLIVLAASGSSDGIIGESSYRRSQYAVLAYREGWVQKMVISGGGKPPTADAMRDFIVSQGVPASIVLTETASVSTRESAMNLRRVVEDFPGSKVLLSSDYHMFRAHRAFLKAGLPVLARPIPDARKRAAGWRGRWPAFLELLQESAKIGYYYLRGWI